MYMYVPLLSLVAWFWSVPIKNFQSQSRKRHGRSQKTAEISVLLELSSLNFISSVRADQSQFWEMLSQMAPLGRNFEQVSWNREQKRV